jgi:hypothetical protein
MTKIYISGPIAADPLGHEHAVQTFTTAEKILYAEGFTAVNPFNVWACDGIRCKPLFPTPKSHTWECYIKYDLREMLRCDGVAMLPGWEISPGARIENFVALNTGIPIKTLNEWIAR